MTRRVRVQWTVPAKDGLASLPKKVRRAILAKTRALADCDPRTAHKPLTGPLQNYYCIKVSRFRAIYKIIEETLPNGDVLVFVRVVIVAVGMRKAGGKRDVYNLAKRLVKFAVSEIEQAPEQEDADET